MTDDFLQYLTQTDEPGYDYSRSSSVGNSDIRSQISTSMHKLLSGLSA
jgi:hypothetical protein